MTNKRKDVLIRVKNLKKYFPVKKDMAFQEQQYVKANDGISLEIFNGETVGLVGESGCGKSTLGRVLLQLYSQTGGATFYYGRSLEDLAPKYVFRTIRGLEKDVKGLEGLREERRKQKANIDSARNDVDKEKAQKAFAKVDQKIDDYFDTTVKIFGGLVLADNLKEVSQIMLEWYKLRGTIIALQRKVNIEELSYDANIANNKQSKANKLKANIEKGNAELEKLEQQLAVVQKKLDEIREVVKKDEKFERYESRKDSGIDLARLKESEMRLLRTDLQIIFQDPYSSLNPRMTVGQIIGEALITHGYFKSGTDKLNEYVTEVMEQCGLQAYMIHRYPHEFSGGQRQRIGIARALAVRPKFVVCDEAVSALDVSIQSQIINLLKELREKQGFSYMFISHDLGVVRYISDRIGVMYLGKLVELSPTEDMFNHTQHPYSEALLAAIPTTDNDSRGKIIPLEGDVPSPVNPPSGCLFHTRCKYCQEICKVEEPAFKEVRPGHFVACHLRGDNK